MKQSNVPNMKAKKLQCVGILPNGPLFVTMNETRNKTEIQMGRMLKGYTFIIIARLTDLIFFLILH